jgi:hypothetical protein
MCPVLPAFSTLSVRLGPSLPARPAERDRPGEPAPDRPEPSPRAPRDRVTVSERARGAGAARERLTPEQRRVLDALVRRDAEVRAHEAAHQAAGGELAGAASFTFEQGPDGRAYAVGGEVPIRLREGRTPEETIAIARRVRRAALAPANPSPQDLAVAASASQLELAAQARARAATAAYGRAGGGRAAA